MCFFDLHFLLPFLFVICVFLLFTFNNSWNIRIMKKITFSTKWHFFFCCHMFVREDVAPSGIWKVTHFEGVTSWFWLDYQDVSHSLSFTKTSGISSAPSAFQDDASPAFCAFSSVSCHMKANRKAPLSDALQSFLVPSERGRKVEWQDLHLCWMEQMMWRKLRNLSRSILRAADRSYSFFLLMLSSTY